MATNPILLENLAKFRDLKISRTELIATPGFKPTGDKEIELKREHVIHLLRAFLSGNISEEAIVEWINAVWWSDWFFCNANDLDVIATVLSELDLLEDVPHLRDNLSVEEAKNYIERLSLDNTKSK